MSNLDIKSRTAAQADNSERQRIYDALIERACGGRMGKMLTLHDLSNGLLGPEGERYVTCVRQMMQRAGVSVDEDEIGPSNFIRSVE